MSSTFPWRLLLLKIFALFSFCGGPLAFADSLKRHMDKDLAFAISFAPTAALIFGVYSLWSTERDRWDKIMVSLGVLGTLALIATNIFAISDLAVSPERADGGLIRLGIAVGTVFAAYYWYAAHRFFRSLPIAA
jgi:drug/metabolite transporter (DMT)-like permease